MTGTRYSLQRLGLRIVEDWTPWYTSQQVKFMFQTQTNHFPFLERLNYNKINLMNLNEFVCYYGITGWRMENDL